MKFTPGQAQDMLLLSPGTFRHWKAALPPLAGRRGYSPCFNPGDLLAIAVVKALTDDAGIQIGKLRAIASDLFEYCSQPWAVLERSVLVIQPSSSCIKSVPETQSILPEGLTITLQLRPIIATLRERLLLEKNDNQQEPLRFPPTAVGGGINRGGGI
jgi:hypothetical protein